jgi:hypothetical protein
VLDVYSHDIHNGSARWHGIEGIWPAVASALHMKRHCSLVLSECLIVHNIQASFYMYDRLGFARSRVLWTVQRASLTMALILSWHKTLEALSREAGRFGGTTCSKADGGPARHNHHAAAEHRLSFRVYSIAVHRDRASHD